MIDVFAAAGCGLLGAAAIAVGVVWAFFSNTRADGYAVLIITFLSAGLLVNVATLAVFRRKAGKPARVWLTAALPWIALAGFETWGAAKDAFIDWSNWRWILSNAAADPRSYDLVWIIRGWAAVAAAGLVGLVLVRMVVGTDGKSARAAGGIG